MIRRTFILAKETMGQCLPCLKQVRIDLYPDSPTHISPRVAIGQVISPAHHAQTTSTCPQESNQAQAKVAIGYLGWKTTRRPM